MKILTTIALSLLISTTAMAYCHNEFRCYMGVCKNQLVCDNPCSEGFVPDGQGGCKLKPVQTYWNTTDFDNYAE